MVCEVIVGENITLSFNGVESRRTDAVAFWTPSSGFKWSAELWKILGCRE